MSRIVPDRFSKISNKVDEIFDEFGEDALYIELALRGYVARNDVLEACRADEALQEFQEHVRLASYTESTRKTYFSEIIQFKRHLDSLDSPDMGVSNLLSGYTLGNYLSTSMISRATRNKKIALLRVFYNFAADKGWVKPKIPEILELIDATEKLPRALTPDMVEELLTLSRHTKNGYKMYMFVLTALATGCRIGEVVNMTTDRIDFNRKTALVFGKNHPEGRTVYLREQAQRLNEYLEFRFGNTGDPFGRARYVFGTGDDGLYQPDTSSLQASFRRIVARMTTIPESIKPFITPHSLRHTFATMAIREGIDILTLSELLGHRHVSTTVRYLHLLETELQDAVEKAHSTIRGIWKAN